MNLGIISERPAPVMLPAPGGVATAAQREEIRRLIALSNAVGKR